jgi:RimJ/RimL family protein N-acetyltransferase
MLRPVIEQDLPELYAQQLQFLGEIELRPMYARAAKDNIRSVRVLEKCGFAIVAEDRFTDARGRLVEEFLFAFTARAPGLRSSRLCMRASLETSTVKSHLIR